MPPDVWTILKLLNWAADYFKSHHVASPRASAEILLSHCLGMERIDLYVQYDRPLESGELKSFKRSIQRKLDGEPVAYIIGEKGFWSLDLRVSPAVLIPRPETEFLVEAALSVLSSTKMETSLKVLDLGTGSGAITLAMASEFPMHRYVAMDISRKALQVAAENANRCGVTEAISFFCGSWFEAFRQPQRPFDMIVSNPPYIPRDTIPDLEREVSVFEPTRALDGGPDGLASIRLIVAGAPRFLSPGGWLFLEIGYDQWEAVKKIVLDTGAYADVSSVRDYAGVHRILRARRKGR